MDKKLTILVALAVVVAAVGVGFAATGVAVAQDDDDDDDDLGEEDVPDRKSDESYQYEIKLTEKNHQNLVRGQPPQMMDSSLERQNLINRYEYLNDENNVHHVYLIDEGQVMGYYVAQGKVSSVNSKLTNDKQIVKAQRAGFDSSGEGPGGAHGPNYKVVESPQMDGSYGTNGPGIFFFTTSGDYVETDLDYVVSEEPRNIQDEVILVDEDAGDDSDE